MGDLNARHTVRGPICGGPRRCAYSPVVSLCWRHLLASLFWERMEGHPLRDTKTLHASCAIRQALETTGRTLVKYGEGIYVQGLAWRLKSESSQPTIQGSFRGCPCGHSCLIFGRSCYLADDVMWVGFLERVPSLVPRVGAGRRPQLSPCEISVGDDGSSGSSLTS